MTSILFIHDTSNLKWYQRAPGYIHTYRLNIVIFADHPEYNTCVNWSNNQLQQ